MAHGTSCSRPRNQRPGLTASRATIPGSTGNPAASPRATQRRGRRTGHRPGIPTGGPTIPIQAPARARTRVQRPSAVGAPISCTILPSACCVRKRGSRAQAMRSISGRDAQVVDVGVGTASADGKQAKLGANPAAHCGVERRPERLEDDTVTAKREYGLAARAHCHA